MKEHFNRVVIASLLLVIGGMVLIFLVAPSLARSADTASIGISLVTAGILALSLDKISLRAISGEIKEIVNTTHKELRMREYGIVDVLDNTPYTEIYRAIDSSKELTIVQTWSPDMKNLLEHAEKLLARGGSVTIFLLHPTSQSARQRSLDLDEEVDYVPDRIRSDTGQVRSMYGRLVRKHGCTPKDIRARLRLFYYSSLPAFALYLTDARAWTAYYWQSAQSDSRMNLVIDLTTKNRAAEHCLQHLHSLQQKSVLVDPEGLEDPSLPNLVA